MGFPPFLSIEPTNKCNLKCLQCPVGMGTLKRKRGEMDILTFKKIIDTTKDYLIYLMLYFQGEPFLNQDIFSMIKYAGEHNVYVVLNTNGHFIRTFKDGERIIQSGLNRIIFSLDGATEESYKIYRSGGDFNTVITGIKNLVEAKKALMSKKPKISIQFIVMKHNENAIEEIKKLAGILGVNDVLLKSVQVYDEEGYENLLPSLERFRRYKKRDGKIILKKRINNRCIRIFLSSVITYDGMVLPCCFDKDGMYSYGSIADEYSFKDIWTLSEANDFRKRVFTNRKDIDICRNCIG